MKDEPFGTRVMEYDEGNPDGRVEMMPAWRPDVPGLVVVWIGRKGFGVWSVTHEVTGYALPHGQSFCCRKHATEWANLLNGFDWTAVASRDGITDEVRDAAAEVVKAAGPTGEWPCGNYAERVTFEEAEAILRWHFRLTDDAPGIGEVLRTAVEYGVMCVPIIEPEFDF